MTRGKRAGERHPHHKIAHLMPINPPFKDPHLACDELDVHLLDAFLVDANVAVVAAAKRPHAGSVNRQRLAVRAVLRARMVSLSTIGQ